MSHKLYLLGCKIERYKNLWWSLLIYELLYNLLFYIGLY